jgi:hypothetical protein
MIAFSSFSTYEARGKTAQHPLAFATPELRLRAKIDGESGSYAFFIVVMEFSNMFFAGIANRGSRPVILVPLKNKNGARR